MCSFSKVIFLGHSPVDRFPSWRQQSQHVLPQYVVTDPPSPPCIHPLSLPPSYYTITPSYAVLPSNPPTVFGIGPFFGNSQRICRLFNQDSYGEKKKKISTKFTIISQEVGFANLQKMQHARKFATISLEFG